MPNYNQVNEVLNNISGVQLEQDLITLASVGGEPISPTIEQPKRYSPSRLALTQADFQGRQHVRGLMEATGLEVDDSHPLALLGTLHGSKPSLAPVTILSHFDTIPEADMYDGVLGVIGGIAVAQAIQASGIQPERSVQVLALTGEESSRFNFALFGSRAAFVGLTAEELVASDANGVRIMDELDDSGIDTVSVPLYGNEFWQLPLPHAAIELHVEQGKRLQELSYDLAVVEAIAAPVRHEILIGDTPLLPEAGPPIYNEYFELTVSGQADHSGATPMGQEHRADGLVESARVLLPLLEGDKKIEGLDLLNIHIPQQALNKIPGITNILLHVGGNAEAEVAKAVSVLKEHINTVNGLHEQDPSALGTSPLTLKEQALDDNVLLLNQTAMRNRYKAALQLVDNVNAIAEAFSDSNVVGTVGTFLQSPDGSIKLGLDVRGIEASSRESALEEIQQAVANLTHDVSIQLSEPLPGSGNPVSMDPELVRAARTIIEEYAIGSATTMFSAAGHDSQNAARAGIPTIMLFVPSRGGIAHNPEAYTSSDHLERGVKALAAIVLQLVA